MSSESHGDMGLLLISWIFKGEVILLHGSRAQLELLLMVLVIEPTCVFVCVDCLKGPELHIDTVPVFIVCFERDDSFEQHPTQE
jgi:hypothetical protein